MAEDAYEPFHLSDSDDEDFEAGSHNVDAQASAPGGAGPEDSIMARIALNSDKAGMGGVDRKAADAIIFEASRVSDSILPL